MIEEIQKDIDMLEQLAKSIDAKGYIVMFVKQLRELQSAMKQEQMKQILDPVIKQLKEKYGLS